ncbi:TonB-dependent receptor [Dyella sp. 2RAB6]|uniref:TonB-dependent receptor n=1 Tax=Dyella sp. 2RAB6 TaxID=3232992 RepID=UPI003F93893D
MTSVSGKTINGFTYEGEYEHANSDRVTWSATYRCRGIFFGMRHGRVNELLGVPFGEVKEAVMDDIELAWIQSG